MSPTSPLIHPSAVIAEGAQIGQNVRIGPFCTVGPDVILGDDVTLHSHVAIAGQTEIGTHTAIFPFSSLGHAPQDLKFQGEKTRLIIGKSNTIREHVTMNPGTGAGGGSTVVGDHNLFMVGSHVAHDCQVGSHVILANNATLAGHVSLADHVIIGGLAAIHQHVRIGQHAIIGGMSGVENDVIPFGSVVGERAALAGLNLVGLKRRGFPREVIHALRGAYKALFDTQNGVLEDRRQQAAKEYASIDEVTQLLHFIEQAGSRSLCTPKR